MFFQSEIFNYEDISEFFRFWKKVFVKLVYQGETPHLELMSKDDGKESLLHEWPLQPCYAISDIGIGFISIYLAGRQILGLMEHTNDTPRH